MRLIIRSLRGVLIVYFAFLLTSCNEVEPAIIYQLTLSETGVVFGMGGGLNP